MKQGTDPDDFINKNYVDNIFLNQMAGGSDGDLDMRGHAIRYLKLDEDPSAAARVVELNLKLDKNGGTMYAPIDMDKHEITNLIKNPILDYEAV